MVAAYFTLYSGAAGRCLTPSCRARQSRAAYNSCNQPRKGGGRVLRPLGRSLREVQLLQDARGGEGAAAHVARRGAAPAPRQGAQLLPQHNEQCQHAGAARDPSSWSYTEYIGGLSIAAVVAAVVVAAAAAAAAVEGL
eukprot:scaffold115563_cov63-Phaeocystis_antarctica.AAC.1